MTLGKNLINNANKIVLELRKTANMRSFQLYAPNKNSNQLH